MTSGKNDRRINSLLQQMQQQVGLSEYKEKAEAEQKKREELAPYMKSLRQMEQQDPFRVSPLPNENTREERKLEDLRHLERQRVMVGVRNRQRMREPRTYS